MRRVDFEYVIAAEANVSGEDEFVVIRSQAVQAEIAAQLSGSKPRSDAFPVLRRRPPRPILPRSVEDARAWVAETRRESTLLTFSLTAA